MARQFVSASTQFLSRSGAVVSGPPFTLAGRFRLRSGGSGALAYLDNVTTGANRLGLLANGVGNSLEIQAQDSGGSGNATSTANIGSAETWYHAAGVFAGISSRTVYLDGANSATSSNTISPTVTDTHFGILNLGGSTFVALDGDLAEWGVWDVALGVDEIIALARGASPLLIRPASLVAYYPVGGDASPEPDRWKNRYDLTLGNAPTKAEHPRLYPPNTGWQLDGIPLFIVGITRDNVGNPLGGCTVKRFRTSDDVLLSSTTSDGSGNYSLPGDTSPSYLVAYKAGSPDVAGVTVNTIVGS